MRIEFLGSGGAVTTPRPVCHCRLCDEARAKGVPYSRGGPSVFVHGPDLLIDTPEEIKDQLNRSQVTQIAACFYSHWHPDHVAGRRVWETMNMDWFNTPPRSRRTPVYLPQQVGLDFRTFAIWPQMEYLHGLGVIDLIELRDGDTVTLNGVQIRPFRLAEEYVYAFLLEGEGQRVLIAPDELFRWQPPDFVQGVDLAVIPMGIPKDHPLTGRQMLPDDHMLLKAEATFEMTLDIVRQLRARRVIMAHLEEPFDLSYDDYLTLAARLRDQGFNITFAYDTMVIDV